MVSITTTPASCLLLATLVVAQAPMVAPVALADTEGASGNPFLFGLKNPVRIMDVYDEAALPFKGVHPIKAISLRMDGRSNPTTHPQKRNILLHLDISTSLKTADLDDRTFDTFHGVDRTRVFEGRLDIPPQFVPMADEPPRSFNVPIAFDRPWFFDLTPVRGGRARASTLVLDYQVYSKVTGTTYVLDMAGFCRHQPTQFGRAARCVGSNGKPITMTANARTFAGNQLQYRVLGAIPKNGIVLRLRAGPLRTLPPPFEIDKGSGCYLNFLSLLTTEKPANSAGAATFALSIPRGRDFVGLEIQAQAAAYDINANNAHHVTSFGLASKICGPHPVCQLMQLNGKAPIAVRAQSNVYGLAHVVSFQ